MKAVVAALVLAVATLGACSSGGGNKATPATSTSTTGPETTVAAGAPQPTTAQATTTRPADITISSFKSPTGNIACKLGEGGVRCDIKESTYTPPPKPAACELDWGDSIELTEQGPAAFFCHGDSVFEAEMSVLPYGSRARQGAMVCTSTEGGVSCFREGTNDGFIISRQTYSLS